MTSNVNLTEPPDLIKRGLVICRETRKDHPFGVFYGENPLDFSFPLFLLQISALIVITRIVRFLLKPLRQPHVISEILGGIILGPSVLSRSKKFQAYMFSENFTYVIKNVGYVGLMYFVFLAGVEMDIMEVKRTGKKHWYISAVSMFFSLGCCLGVGMLERKSLDRGLQIFSSLWGISLNLSIASFAVVYPIVRELNLLSSGIGRMALSTTMISDVIGLSALLIFEMLIQGQHRPIYSLYYLLSFVAMGASFIGMRRAMMWIIRTTPVGKPVDEGYVTGILLLVMVAGLISDTIGLTVANGPMWLGLAVPNGPPLGTALGEKAETIMRDILMPFSFMYIGQAFDLGSLSGHWARLRPVILMVLSAYVVKIVATFVAARFNHMTIRDSLTLSLLLGVKGQVDFLLFVHLNDLKILDTTHFTFLSLSAACVTAVVTPSIAILYDPTRPYLLSNRQNIQHSPPSGGLQVVACIHSEENLSGLMRLLELSTPAQGGPLSVDALCLVELAGQSHPVLIDHREDDGDDDEGPVHNALNMFQQARGESIKIHPYTTITSRKSMYQDICQLALSHRACLIVLPLDEASRSLNSDVLQHAPCSVAILFDKTPLPHGILVHGALRAAMHHLALLFLGGPDAREALAYADRMAENPDVSLSVVRFLPHNSEGENEMDKKLDDGLVTQFWLKSEGKDRIDYREVVVKNGEETIAAIQGMDKQYYDLWIVGRKHGINPVLLRGISNWDDDDKDLRVVRQNKELGVIGEYVASEDFDSTASVLAVQQQILRGQETVSASLLRGISLSIFKR